MIFRALSSTIKGYPNGNPVFFTDAYTRALRLIMQAEIAYLWNNFLYEMAGVQPATLTDYQIELFIASVVPVIVAEVLQTTMERARVQQEINDAYIALQRARSRSLSRTIVSTAMNKSLLISLKATGLNWYKSWVAERDDRTRDAHRVTNPNQYIPIDSAFNVGGEPLMFPTDTSMGASAWNIVNCRCQMDFKVL